MSVIEQILTPEQARFAAEMRQALAADVPAALARKTWYGEKTSKSDYQAWAAQVADKGWTVPGWPRAHGGPGWGPIERYLFDEAMSLAGAPRANLVGTDLLGPALIRYGSPEQQGRFLPGIRTGAQWWCQGFSEAGAGSDLAALSTRARRIDGGWKVSGTKLWVSYAQEADWMFCLARTSEGERRQEGLSLLLFPMDGPGICVSGITTLGVVKVVNEVHLDDAFVKDENLLGLEGQGWDIARVLLGNERVMGAWLGHCTRCLHRARELAFRRDMLTLSSVREALARFEAELLAVKLLAFRVMQAEIDGEPAGIEVSVLKLTASALHQDLSEFLFDLAGDSSSEDALIAQEYFDKRKLTIYGGSAEVQRNLIARSVLGR